MVNGSDDTLLKKAKVYTMDDLMRLPSVSRIHFIECGANTGLEWGNVAVPTVQYTHGMLSCSEFTGVPLKYLLEDCGVDYKKARYVLAEGADGSSMTRTIPMEMVESGEVFVAYGQNGEMLRPENGYPLRLSCRACRACPGSSGCAASKSATSRMRPRMRQCITSTCCRAACIASTARFRKQVGDHHAVRRSDPARQGLLQRLRSRLVGSRPIKQVDVSFDGGINWQTARIEGPVQNKALTRFNINWVWDGKPAILQSRAIDETGYVQPSYGQLRKVRGTKSIYHNNAIQSWKVVESGEVSNVQVL
jgi:sulfane dehydrogenase subunit SoxC